MTPGILNSQEIKSDFSSKMLNFKPTTGCFNAGKAQNVLLCRSIATVSYRSGKEWETRFGRRKIVKSKGSSSPCFSADFTIEGYLDHQVSEE